ncbi:Retrovirus-related Pol polyprotein from type-1 retrotransposable element R1, partial [Stegodyphus mimosarum]
MDRLKKFIDQEISELEKRKTNEGLLNDNESCDSLILSEEVEPETEDKKGLNKFIELPTTWNVISHEVTDASQAPRAALYIINRTWSPIVIKNYRDIITISISTSNSDLYFTSAYASPSEDLETTLHDLHHILQRHPHQHLISGDFNAHSNLWGYHRNNTRNMLMEDFINAHNLMLHNTPDDSPTFVTINGKGWPDLTLSSHHLINRISNRRICEDESISDHQIVSFDITFEVPRTQTLRYRISRNAEKKFTKALNSKAHIILHEIQSINSKDEANAYASTLTKHIQEISHTSLKIKTVNHNTKPNWWTKELQAERQKTKALRQKMKRRTTDEERKAAWIDYNKQRAIYKKKLIEAKLKSWRSY